jgi:uncharacterized protein
MATVDDQQDVIAFLHDPASYAPEMDAVEVIETHASLVFLAGSYAYKLKRAVKYPYLDFSTAARRQIACTAELRLNRRSAPQLYLEVRAISRGRDGRLHWDRFAGGRLDPVDFVVVMRRFDQRDVFDKLAARGELSASMLYALCAHIAAFHAKAERRFRYGGAAAMAGIAASAIGILRERRAAGFEAAQIDRVAAGIHAEIGRVGPLLNARRDAGKVRRVHGDLHLRNVCLVDGRPVLFDCIEFSDDIASIDVLYDLAFLLMDLDHLGYGGFANLVMNRYLDLAEEDGGLAALPLFIALRAAIRAHITATMAEHGWGGKSAEREYAEARRYLASAEAALAPSTPLLIAIGGLSGSGKSTLAARLAPELGHAPGARILRSDVLRKLRFGSEPESPLPLEAYTPEVTERVYRDLRERAAVALRGGYSAVIDAVALRPEERRAFTDVAAAAGVRFTGLWLEAPQPAMAARLGARRDDASDATDEVLALQSAGDPGVIDWVRIDAAGDADATLAAARQMLAN